MRIWSQDSDETSESTGCGGEPGLGEVTSLPVELPSLLPWEIFGGPQCISYIKGGPRFIFLPVSSYDSAHYHILILFAISSGGAGSLYIYLISTCIPRPQRRVLINIDWVPEWLNEWITICWREKRFPKAALNHCGGAETKVEGTREVAVATGCHVQSIWKLICGGFNLKENCQLSLPGDKASVSSDKGAPGSQGGAGQGSAHTQSHGQASGR